MQSRNQTIRLWPPSIVVSKVRNMVFLAAVLENDSNVTETYVKSSAITYVRKNLSSYLKRGHTRRRSSS